MKHIAKLDAMLADERERLRDAQMSRERALAIRQKEKDLAKAKESRLRASDSATSTQGGHSDKAAIEHDDRSSQAQMGQSNGQGGSSKAAAPQLTIPETSILSPNSMAKRPRSHAQQEWERQKNVDHKTNDAIDSLMEMIGLEEVKLQILRIKAKVEATLRQNSEAKDRLNTVFQGSPGTGSVFICIFSADTS